MSINNYLNKIKCTIYQLNLTLTLNSGQSFRWKEFNNGWIGVVKNQVWFLKQDQEYIYYQFYDNKSNLNKDDKIYNSINDSLITDYFQLNIDLQELYDAWCSVDENFKKKAADLKGVRILKQDPVENIFSFICSTNNNINRISSLVEKLCSEYGEPIIEIDGYIYKTFPTVEALSSENVENDLKTLGFGYRGKYIASTARYLKESYSIDYLYDLRNKSYNEVKKFLLDLPGIGPKVADCVSLMSLNKLNAVPVDTHVRQIAERDYNLKIKSKSLSDSSYQQISQFFQDLWGEYAGWAQSVLFTAELKRKRTHNKTTT